MNKYNKWYTDITARAKTRLVTGYTESHHIIPRSLGGTDDEDNVVKLTAREHFVCHWLLVKMTTGDEHWKMLNALRIMRAENPKHQRYRTKITARVYANLKEEYSVLQSEQRKGGGNGMYGRNHTEEAKRRISKANKGRKQSYEEKEKQKAAMTGRTRGPFNDEWRTNLSKSRQGEKNHRFGVEVSEETRQKISDKAKLRKNSLESNAKRSVALLGGKREKLLCPHCEQSVAVNGYARWHGDRCKLKP